MDRQTIVLGIGVAAYAMTKDKGPVRITTLPWPKPEIGPVWAVKVFNRSQSQFDHARFLSYEARSKWLAQLFQALKKCITLRLCGHTRESTGLSVAWTSQTDFIEHEARK